MKKLHFLMGVFYFNTACLLVIFVHFSESIISSFNHTGAESDFLDRAMDYFSVIFLIWLALYVLSSIINIVSVINDFRNKRFNLLYRKMKRIKLGLIPYWIINFICYLPISALLIVAGHGFGFLVVPVFIFASYTVLLVTSVFSILYLLHLKTAHIITSGTFAKHAIMQLLFVFDIIGTFIIIRKYNEADAIS